MFKVMLVDDQQIIRRQIKRIPVWGEYSGFQVVQEAEDGREALDKLLQAPVDLLISDIKMPRINGLELLKEVSEKQLATCVVFLSEYQEFSYAQEAIKYGVFDYLVKPVQQEELSRVLEKVQEYIKNKQAEQVKLQSLEENLSSGISVYYPDRHIKTVIELLLRGNSEALLKTRSMAEDVIKAVDYHLVKAEVLLEKAHQEIWEALYCHHPWMEKFADSKVHSPPEFSKARGTDHLVEKLEDRVKLLLELLDKFVFMSYRHSVIEQVCKMVLNQAESELSVHHIAEVHHISKNYLGDLFKSETGKTLCEYITMVKMERAVKILRTEDVRTYEVAYRLGYKNQEYFSKVFKRYTGRAPSELKPKHQ